MILSSKKGNTSYNSIRFFPYRNVPSTIKIELLDISTPASINTIVKGQPVILKISIPSGITIVTPITIRNLSGEKLLHRDSTDVLFSKMADTYLDTVSFNNKGMGAIVINSQTSDYKIISECSQPFTVACQTELSIRVSPRHMVEFKAAVTIFFQLVAEKSQRFHQNRYFV